MGQKCTEMKKIYIFTAQTSHCREKRDLGKREESKALGVSSLGFKARHATFGKKMNVTKPSLLILKTSIIATFWVCWEIRL